MRNALSPLHVYSVFFQKVLGFFSFFQNHSIREENTFLDAQHDFLTLDWYYIGAGIGNVVKAVADPDKN